MLIIDWPNVDARTRLTPLGVLLALSSVVRVNGWKYLGVDAALVHVPCSRKDASNKMRPRQACSLLARVPAFSN